MCWKCPRAARIEKSVGIIESACEAALAGRIRSVAGQLHGIHAYMHAAVFVFSTALSQAGAAVSGGIHS
jgi:hypothetical protein